MHAGQHPSSILYINNGRRVTLTLISSKKMRRSNSDWTAKLRQYAFPWGREPWVFQLVKHTPDLMGVTGACIQGPANPRLSLQCTYKPCGMQFVNLQPSVA